MNSVVQLWRHRLADAIEGFARPGRVARVAMNLRPVYHSWGGGNQWLTQTTRYLRRTGYTVRFDLAGEVDVVVATHFGLTGRTSFSLEELRSYLHRHPRTRFIHRINDNDARKRTTEMDQRLAQYDALAHHTVFISEWLRDHHAARWFDPSRPHSVIVNGADPATFHPVGGTTWHPGTPFRLVTHHWSDNQLKGFDIYAAVDDAMASGRLPGIELWVIGRWPADLVWKAARTFGPCQGEGLAKLLRQCHGYLTASRWEPGGMHFIEGAQCGLPVLFHEDGGGIVEVARRFGVGFCDDPLPALAELRARYRDLRSTVLSNPPSGDEMGLSYRKLLQRVLADAPQI